VPKSKNRRGGPSGATGFSRTARLQAAKSKAAAQARRERVTNEHTQPGARNAYQCQKCKGHVVTVHVDPGVTPMFLACRVNGEPAARVEDVICDGQMVSGMYRPFSEELGEPTYEWYTPEKREYSRLPFRTKDHVDMGGLLLRPIITKSESETADASRP
jgi:hypothetical protein